MNILEPIMRTALAAPDSPAIVTGQQTLSYATLMHHVAAMASQLVEQGVQRGEVVGIAAEGLLGHVMSTLAIARVGATSVPFTNMSAQEMSSYAQICGANAVVYNESDRARVDASGLARRFSLQELTSNPPRAMMPLVRGEPGDLARIAFSSGTTGRPKAVKFTHDNMVLRTHLTRTVYPVTPGERLMLLLPVGLHFSLGYILLFLMGGGTLVERGETVAEVAERIRTEKVTMLLTSPGTAVELVKFAQANPEYAAPSPHLQTLCMGGASVAPALQNLLRQHVCPNLYINYGMTEAGGLVAQADTALMESHPTAAGRLMPWVEIDAVDESGKPVPFGTEGRLRVRSPCLANGYLGVGAEAGDAFRDGWFYSGDLGAVTVDGLVYLGGRAEVLNVGGTKVRAEALEGVIAQDPAILECAALTMPDALQHQRLLVVVVAPKGFDANALQQRCVRSFGAAFAPDAVIAVESLPHNPAGKIQRRELPALVARHGAAVKAGPPSGT
jgi:acyl-coenzyme A synthetase/AMP-(fatty) acid ligase